MADDSRSGRLRHLTYFKVIGCGWMHLSTILDDFCRNVIAWKLCTTMKTPDVTDTLDMSLKASGVDQVGVRHKARSKDGAKPSRTAFCWRITSC